MAKKVLLVCAQTEMQVKSSSRFDDLGKRIVAERQFAACQEKLFINLTI